MKHSLCLVLAAGGLWGSVLLAGCASCGCEEDAKPAKAAAADGAPWVVAKPRVSDVAAGPVFDVGSYGANGDANVVVTTALQKALDECAAQGGGVVRFAAGTYVTGSLMVGSNTTIRLEKGALLTGSPAYADYPVFQGRWEGGPAPSHHALLWATGATRIAIVGEGTIAGNDAVEKARAQRTLSGQVIIQPAGDGSRAPPVLEFVGCKDIRIEGITLRQTDMWTTHPFECEDLLYRNVTFVATGGKSNAVDADSTRRLWIDHCSLSNEEDAVALKSGKGDEGRRGRPTEDVLITDCVFHGKPYAGIALGSECAGGIERVQVERCTFEAGLACALRFKTATGRGGFVEHVRVRDVTTAATNFIQGIINTNNPDPEPLPGVAGISGMADVDVQGVSISGGTLLSMVGTADRPIAGLRLHDVSGTCAKAMTIAHATGVDLANINVTGFAGPRLTIFDIEGTGLDGATVTIMPAAAGVRPVSPDAGALPRS